MRSRSSSPSSRSIPWSSASASIDSGRRSDPAIRYPVLLQVNVDLDPAKHGFQPAAVASALPAMLALPHLDVRGLMTVGRFTADPDVSRARSASSGRCPTRLRADQPELGPELSMGMTDDFEIAIEEGATIVRVGRAIFGERSTGGW